MANYKLKYSGEKIDEILTKADRIVEVGTATGETAGKVKLSDATNETSDVSAGVSATPKAVKAAYDSATAANETVGALSQKVDANTDSIVENTSAVSQLKEDLVNLKDGFELLSHSFIRGNLNSDGTINTDIPYRVATPDFMKYDRDIVLSIEDGIYMTILVFDENKQNPIRTGGITKTYNVISNTYFKIGLLRIEENTSEVANLSEWKNYVTLSTVIEDRLVYLEKNANKTSEYFDNLLNGRFVLGNLNTDGESINTDIKYRVASISFMKYDHDIKININSGFMIALFIYDSNKQNPVRTGGIKGEYVISANTYFKVCIMRETDIPTETINIDDFVSQVVIVGKINEIEKTILSPLNGKKIGFLGDSIVGTDYTTPTWWQMIASKTGMIPTNYGISGTSIAHNDEIQTSFGVCVSERYTSMSDDLDGVVLMCGTNDRGENPRGNWDDSTTSTFFGALNVLLDGLAKKYAGKPIIFCTPIPRANNDYGKGDGKLNPLKSLEDKQPTDTLTNPEITEAIIAKCRQYGIQFIDMSVCGINGSDTNRVYYRTDDSWHPSEIGQKAIANYVYKRIEQSFIF